MKAIGCPTCGELYRTETIIEDATGRTVIPCADPYHDMSVTAASEPTRGTLVSDATVSDAEVAPHAYIANAVPTTWLDPLLSGPDAVAGLDRCDARVIEALLRAVKARVNSSALVTINGIRTSTGQAASSCGCTEHSTQDQCVAGCGCACNADYVRVFANGRYRWVCQVGCGQLIASIEHHDCQPASHPVADAPAPRETPRRCPSCGSSVEGIYGIVPRRDGKPDNETCYDQRHRGDAPTVAAAVDWAPLCTHRDSRATHFFAKGAPTCQCGEKEARSAV